jgi:hypothetical protein
MRGVTIKGPTKSAAKSLDITRPMEATLDFLGEAFGVRGRPLRRQAKSIDRPSSTPVLDIPPLYMSQQPLTYSTPLPQGAFPTIPSVQQALVQPIPYATAFPHPVHPDLDQLRRIDAHYRWVNGQGFTKFDHGTTNECNNLMATVSVGKHTCANCGRIRSKRYYAEHPIKPGEIPIQEFCRKCQKDASSTSNSSSYDLGRGRKLNKEKCKDLRNNKVCYQICLWFVGANTKIQAYEKIKSSEGCSSMSSKHGRKQDSPSKYVGLCPRLDLRN